jgi:D-sedoheptulose 7-phosphate isomerase
MAPPRCHHRRPDSARFANLLAETMKGSASMPDQGIAAQAFKLDAAALLHSELDGHRVAFEATALAISQSFEQALDILENGVRRGGKLLLFGNGGSASDAQHIATELIIRYKNDRPSIAALSLATDTSALTACGNDLGFDAIFERQIEGLGREHDVAFAISTSGKSANVLRGIRQAQKMGLKSVALSGHHGGELAALCDACIVVPSSVTARIQEMHILIGHALCTALEQRLGWV